MERSFKMKKVKNINELIKDRKSKTSIKHLYPLLTAIVTVFYSYNLFHFVVFPLSRLLHQKTSFFIVKIIGNFFLYDFAIIGLLFSIGFTVNFIKKIQYKKYLKIAKNSQNVKKLEKVSKKFISDLSDSDFMFKFNLALLNNPYTNDQTIKNLIEYHTYYPSLEGIAKNEEMSTEILSLVYQKMVDCKELNSNNNCLYPIYIDKILKALAVNKNTSIKELYYISLIDEDYEILVFSNPSFTMDKYLEQFVQDFYKGKDFVSERL